MNLKEILEFKKYISSHSVSLVGTEDSLTFQDLFKKFSEYEIHTRRDYKHASKHFKLIMTNFYKHIGNSEEINEHEFQQKLNIFCRHIHNSLNPNPARIHKQEPYVGVIKSLIPCENRILDVGAGTIPHSSFMMAPLFKEVKTLDKFAVCEEALTPFDVKAKDGYFESNTNIDDVDFIVGNRPCSAIQKIVEQASARNKGYVIKLCDCDLSNIAYNSGLGYRNWDQILPEIDSKVQFCENYAYNVDATVEQFMKVTEASQIENRYSMFEFEEQGIEPDLANAKVYFEEFKCQE